MPQRNNVCPIEPLSKDKFQRKLAAAWGRVWPTMGKGVMAERMGLNDAKTIDRAVTASNLPEAHTVFNSLVADISALDEVLKEYGLRAAPRHAVAANDMALAADLSLTVTEFLKRLADGKRCHIDTAVLAELFRRLIPQMQAVVDEHDERVAA
ncbi:hypothetical protein [Sphingomonas sp.]|uniref:hypothetical protein n=1 Tax=Sphingomonas sp. TaxID=28214 RepID=UPI0031E0FF55